MARPKWWKDLERDVKRQIPAVKAVSLASSEGNVHRYCLRLQPGANEQDVTDKLNDVLASRRWRHKMIAPATSE